MTPKEWTAKNATENVILKPHKLNEPETKYKEASLIFVNSMSDLFHEQVPDEYIINVSRVMRLANWHTYQILTKRSERMRDLLNGKLKFASAQPNIWWGVSVEDQKLGYRALTACEPPERPAHFFRWNPCSRISASSICPASTG